MMSKRKNYIEQDERYFSDDEKAQQNTGETSGDENTPIIQIEPKDKEQTNQYSDEVKSGYEKICIDIEEKTKQYLFFKQTFENKYWDEFIEEFQEELDKTKLSWLHIKPKDFLESQSQALALDTTLMRIRSKVAHLESEINSLKLQRTQYENSNSLFMPLVNGEPGK